MKRTKTTKLPTVVTAAELAGLIGVSPRSISDLAGRGIVVRAPGRSGYLLRESVRGFIAAETIGRSWFEYGLENVRRQSALAGEPLDQVDADVRAHAECSYHFFVQHESGAEVSKLGEQCKEMIRSYAGVPDTFMHQIGDISLAKQWKQVDIPVLVIYGTSDPATSGDEIPSSGCSPACAARPVISISNREAPTAPMPATPTHHHL